MAVASAMSAAAQESTNMQERAMSLEDCIEIALHHNLDVQIKRFSPELAGYTLAGTYGAYDPTLSLGGSHSYFLQPGGIDQQGRFYAGTENESDTFNGGLAGLLPWGLTYNLTASLSDQYGNRPAFIADTNSPFIVTNTFFDLTANQPVTFLSTNFSTITTRAPFENTAGDVGFATLRQPLLKNFWIDNTRLQIFLNKQGLKSSELDVRFQIMSTIFQVEQAYNNLIAADETVIVQQQALELAERQVAENKKRVEVGTMAPLDEKQAESQAAQSKADLINALGAQETQGRALKVLLSDDYSKWEKVIIKPTVRLVAVPQRFNLQESWRLGLSQRPDILQQRLSMESQVHIVKYQKNQLYPELDLVGTYGYNGSAKEFSGALDQWAGRDNPFWSYGAQMTIPLSQTSARNNYKSAKATQQRIALQLKQLEQNVLILIENDIAVANTRYLQVQATHEATVYAQDALDAERKKLESGKSTSFIVLQLTKDLTTAASNEISALVNYNNALAQIALDEGSILDRLRVKVEVK